MKIKRDKIDFVVSRCSSIFNNKLEKFKNKLEWGKKRRLKEYHRVK